MYEVWEGYFSDVPRKNFVITKFGKYAKRQLGCIKYVRGKTKVKYLLKKYKEEIISQDINTVSIIVLTKYFQDDEIPEYVLISTIAHEISHYAHGFHSPLQQIYEKPHQGGIVKKEMDKRGLKEIQEMSAVWLKENWVNIISN